MIRLNIEHLAKVSKSNKSRMACCMISAFALFMAVFCCASICGAAATTLGWDESPEPGVAGYYIYCGTTSGSYNESVQVVGKSTTTCPIDTLNLVSGQTSYLAITAYADTGEESSYSNEIIYEEIKPTTVTNLQSTTHTVGGWSLDTRITVQWTAAADTGGSGLGGYSIVWDTNSDTLPDTTKDIDDVTTTTSTPLGEGSYYFHIRSVDHALNWSDTAEHIGPFCIYTDSPAPYITSAIISGNTIEIAYSEPVLHATDEANYRFSPSLNFATAENDITDLGGNTYRLTMASVYPYAIYALTVSGITDQSSRYMVSPDSIIINDDDNDDMADDWEMTKGVVDPYADPDNDGLLNVEEYETGTEPDTSDTDGDGLPDGWEVGYGLDPTNASGFDGPDDDLDNDGFSNYDEYSNGTNPADALSFPDSDDTREEVIIDNGDDGTSYTGNWRLSSGDDPYGDCSLYNKTSGDTYTFEAAVEGAHTVSMWWTLKASRSESIAVEIYDGATLLDTVYVNQQENAAQWNMLGTYVFNNTARVTIISTGDDTSTCADAVKFVSGTAEPGEVITVVDELIIDNGDDGTSYTGNWRLSSGDDPYGDCSLYNKTSGDTYTFEAAVEGAHTVSMWWTLKASRSESIAVEIYDGATLLDTVYVNQQENAAQWNMLGTYVFNNTARVTIISTGDDTSTCADAIRFVADK